jgi:hypothetical protein
MDVESLASTGIQILDRPARGETIPSELSKNNNLKTQLTKLKENVFF